MTVSFANVPHKDPKVAELAKTRAVVQERAKSASMIPKRAREPLTTRAKGVATTSVLVKPNTRMAATAAATSSRARGREPVPDSRYMRDTQSSRMRSQSRKRTTK